MRAKLLLVIILSFALQACVPAAFVAGATAGGAVIYDNRSLGTIKDDNQTTLQIQKQIANNPNFAQSHIVVSTFNHIVLLAGQTPNADLSQQAYNIANSIPNVKRIYNEITIEQPTSNWRQSQDAWLTTKIKAAMLSQTGLRSTQIKVVTENGVVYLLGLVTRSQGNLAAETTSKVTGIQKVVKLFEYLN